MPRFSINGYKRTLLHLQAAGYDFLPITQMGKEILGPSVFLRHDVDLHISMIEEFAQLES